MKSVIYFFVGVLLHFASAQGLPKNASTNAAPVPVPPKLSNSTKIICYYDKLSQNRSEPYKFQFTDVNSSLCTHVIYSFATIDPVTLTIKDDSLGKDYENVSALKEKGVVVMLSLGGGKLDAQLSDKYSMMINNGTLRNQFVDNTVRFLKEHKFQGLDINWHYPTCWGGDCKRGRPGDKANFPNLLRDLSTAFRFYKFQLSVAVSPLDSIDDKAYDVKKIAGYVDFINLMAFDYNNETYTTTVINSPFQGSAPNVVHTVEYWKTKGAPANKLVLGIPTFARTFTLANEQWTAPNAPAVIGKPTNLGQPGRAAYFEVCTNLDYQMVENVGPYAFKGDQWCSFDDVAQVKRKGEFIKKSQLAGAMIWSLDTDDFLGNSCGQGKYPLINALRSALGV